MRESSANMQLFPQNRPTFRPKTQDRVKLQLHEQGFTSRNDALPQSSEQKTPVRRQSGLKSQAAPQNPHSLNEERNN